MRKMVEYITTDSLDLLVTTVVKVAYGIYDHENWELQTNEHHLENTKRHHLARTKK